MYGIHGKDTVIVFAKCKKCGWRSILVRRPGVRNEPLGPCRNRKCDRQRLTILQEGRMEDLIK